MTRRKPPPRQLTTGDIATRLGIAPSTVRAYNARGQMPAPTGRLGREPWWDAEAVEGWLAGREVKR